MILLLRKFAYVGSEEVEITGALNVTVGWLNLLSLHWTDELSEEVTVQYVRSNKLGRSKMVMEQYQWLYQSDYANCCKKQSPNLSGLT